jgi:DNA replication protein DnaC
MKPTIVKEIMRDYERDRLKAEISINSIKDEIYMKIPRVKEIDEALSKTGLYISKQILQNSHGFGQLVEDLQRKSQKLIEEKKKLLHTFGYSNEPDVYKCKACKDTGFIGNNKCTCYSQKLINKFYEYSNLQNVLDSQNFSNFKLDYFSEETTHPRNGVSSRKNIEHLYKRSIYFIDNFKTFFINLFLTGDTGLGKTFFCSCIAKEILDKGYTVLYLTSAQLFKQVENARFNESDLSADYINMVYSVDLLIIDDLGTEFSTSVTDSELFNLLNSRILEKRATIISTNLSFNNLRDYYSKRIVSRIVGDYEQWYFYGQDIRRERKHHKPIS